MPIWDAILNKDAQRPEQTSSDGGPPQPIPTSSAEAEGRWNLNKIKNALDGRDDQERTVEEAHGQSIRAAIIREKDRGGLLGKLADVLDGDDEEKLQLELVKIEAELKALDDLEKQLHAQQDFGDKLKNMLGKEDPEDVKTKERIRTERERLNLLREDIMKRLAAERANPNVLEKVHQQVLGPKQEEEEIRRREEALATQKANASWHEKIKDQLTETEQEKQLRLDKEALYERQKNSVQYKVGAVLGTNPPPPGQDQGLSAKLNELAGGGAKGEAKEDKLDKAIDLFQQHVLKEGSQSNESAFEQQKDKAIADGLRAAFKTVTGK